MYIRSLAICPYLKGTTKGAECAAAKKFIKDIQDIDIKVCLGRHHEACSIYFCSLQTVPGGDIYETSNCAGI